jgi:hypothetical protein
VDRESARKNLGLGLRTAAIAIGVFGLTFFAAINYLG